MHNSAISCLVYNLCVCTGDIPLSEASGLSSHTDTQTIHKVTLVYSMEMIVQLLKKSMILICRVWKQNKVKVADSPCPMKSMTPVLN